MPLSTPKRHLPAPALTVLNVTCPYCKAAPGSQCVNTVDGEAYTDFTYQHQARHQYLAGYRAGYVDAIAAARETLADMPLPRRERKARR
jgi:hypothetical protein